jgi:putative oxygen-independent coproporphyrinogen III oxidase
MEAPLSQTELLSLLYAGSGLQTACGTIGAMNSQGKKLGAYIQVPFCQTKCTYCNFHTGVVSRERYAPYADAVCREIAGTAREWKFGAGDNAAAEIDTVYFGGGTPSLLEAAALKKILDALQNEFGFAAAGEFAEKATDVASGVETPEEAGGVMSELKLRPPKKSSGAQRGSFARDGEMEITLEADPETITREKASAWIDAGFNRVSLGVQSFNDVELKAAGRMHRRADTFAAADVLREAGFRNISMDLIAGLAHQTRESWEESVAQLAEVRPEHVSIYMLEIDEGSHLGKESLAGGNRYSAGAIPSDDAIADSYEWAREALRAAGYEHYEISNWGLPGFRSRHNLKYWRREPYIGFGAGAHSFDGAKRWANVHDSAKYVACIEQGISTREQEQDVTRGEALEEELFLGLRQLEGVDLGRIERAYGVDLTERVTELRAQGLVDVSGDRLRLAPDRLAVSNSVLVELLS